MGVGGQIFNLDKDKGILGFNYSAAVIGRVEKSRGSGLAFQLSFLVML